MAETKLTKQQLKEVEDAFIIFDADQSGEIDQNEMTLATQSLGIYLAPQQMEKLFQDFSNENNAIDKNTFIKIMIAKIQQRDSLDNLQKVFRIQNVSGNGYLSLEDMKQVRDELNEHETDEQLLAMLQKMSLEGKDTVTEKEYLVYTDRTFDLY